jgi:hypothetical protein
MSVIGGAASMKIFLVVSARLLLGCAAWHSPHDLQAGCQNMGSRRMSSIGARAQAPANCDQALQADLADRTSPRVLYIPTDPVMSPVIAVRGARVFLGRTRPPF